MHDIPFRIASNEAPLILLQGHVNNIGPIEFLLDTGNGAAVPLFVSPSLVRRLGLSVEATDGMVCLQNLELGNYHQEQLRAAVLDTMDQIGTRVGAPIGGNIGYSFLKDWQVAIDYRGSSIHLTSNQTPAQKDGVPFETGPGGAFILLPAVANGKGPYRFLLDTGASASVISPGLARELQVEGESVEAMGVAGSTGAHLGVLESLEVAGHSLRHVRAAVIDIFGYTSQAAGTPVEGIIGYSFLKEFFVLIDYPNRRIHLSRGAG